MYAFKVLVFLRIQCQLATYLYSLLLFIEWTHIYDGIKEPLVVPINLTYPLCLQHSFFEHLFNLYLLTL